MPPAGYFRLVLTAEFPHNLDAVEPLLVTTDHPYSLNEAAIEGVLRYICRKEGLRDDSAEEFSQWTRLKLIENDCAILRSFKGTCPFKNFLITVVLNKYRDWLDETKGKFRNTAEARRLGPIAINLERLVLRDHVPYEEAVELLLSRGIASARQQCHETWAQLKRAARRQLVPDDCLENRPAVPSADPVEDAERLELTRKVYAALTAALDALPPADNLIFRWKYWDHLTIAKIAKLQRIEQKPLYRRFEQLLKHLERELVSRGITHDEIRELFDDLGIDFEQFTDEGGK